MLLALGRNEEAVAELSKLVEPRDAETPRYLFALSAAYVRTGIKDEGDQVGDRGQGAGASLRTVELAAIIERDLAKLK